MLPLRFGPAWLLAGWLGVALAIVVSLWPGGVPLPFSVWDKIQHGTGYFVLTLWFTGLYPREKYPRIGVACFLLGVLIELLQALTPTRTMEFADVVANTAGVALALAASYVALGGWAARLERAVGLAPRPG